MQKRILHKRNGTKLVSFKRHTPPRVAPRLEGVVKNVGIKPEKKKQKHK